MNSLLNGLNEPQAKAVTSPIGNTLVLAGAGSGKTRVLVSRIAWLIEEHHFSPHSILAVTFTNKAANEMKKRLSHMLSVPVMGLWVGTFHGLCHRLLRRHYKEANLPDQFHIIDSEDQLKMVKRIMESLNLDPKHWPFKQAQHFINNKKDEGLRPHHIHFNDQGPTKTLVKIYQAYEQACQIAGVIDFAELVLRTHELLRDNPEILAQYHQRFKAILVDEFQDTNTIQYAWIRLLASQDAAMMVVGDDDQSIYGWRGAKIENIQRFSRDFKNTEIIRLEQNYRSTGTILEAANSLITNNPSRMGKELWTADGRGEKIRVYKAFNDLDEARFVSQSIKKEIEKGTNADDIAILYRSNAQSRVFEEALLRFHILYRIYGGVRFFDRAEIKDALAYLRLIVNRNDDAAFDRVVNFPTRGIGEKTLEELRFNAKTHQCSLWDGAKMLLESGSMAQRASGSLQGFIHLIEELHNNTIQMTLDEQLHEVIEKSGLYAHFSKIKGEKSESRIENLQELINAGKQFRYEHNPQEDLPLVNAFLAHASLESGEMDSQNMGRPVHLMTLHSSKGLEFPVVFLVGMEEGLFPGKQSMNEPGRLEEERRLCYVGMTRAMKKLILTYAELRRLYGGEEYHIPSRFLKEIPQELLEEVHVKSAFQSTKTQVMKDHSSSHPGINLGQQVTHPVFGQGVVLSVEGSGQHTRVQVKFKEDGLKWLVLAYAKLTIVEEDLPF